MNQSQPLTERALRAIDAALGILEDALEWALSKVGRAPRHRHLLDLEQRAAFFADVSLPTDDPVEAQAATAYQIGRHAPISPEQLIHGLVTARGDGNWHVAMARKSELEARVSDRKAEGFRVSSPAGKSALLRLPEQSARWRRNWVTRIAMVLILAFSILLFLLSIENWLDRRSQALRAQETAYMSQAVALREELDAAQSAEPAITSISIPELIDLLGSVHNVKPDNWHLRQYQWSSDRLTVVFDENVPVSGTPAQFASAFRGALGTNEIALTRETAGSGRSHIRLVAMLDRGAP